MFEFQSALKLGDSYRMSESCETLKQIESKNIEMTAMNYTVIQVQEILSIDKL